MALPAWCALLLLILPQAPVEPRGECTLDAAGAERIARAFADHPDPDEAEAALELHAREHGWAIELQAPDFVTDAGAARCPDAVLDALAKLHRTERHHMVSVHAVRSCAVALQRSGRLDAALEQIERLLVEARLVGQLSFPEQAFRSHMIETALRLCEREGRFDLAYEYSRRWETAGRCAEASDAQAMRQRCVRAELLLRAGRFEETIELLAPCPRDEIWPSSLRIWIDAQLATGRCNHPDAAAALFAIDRGPYADFDRTAALGKRLWELRRASRAVQMANLEELVFEQDYVLGLRAELGPREFREHAAAFDVVDGEIRSHFVAELLAGTGHPDLKPLVESAVRGLGEQDVGLGKLYESAHARWLAVRSKR